MGQSGYIGDGEPRFTVRFTGAELDQRSVPIYDLGETLLAVQDMIRRAYLFERGKLGPDVRLSADERRQLALRMAQRRAGSDIYDLVAFLQNPIAQSVISDLITAVILALGAIAGKAVIHHKRRDTVGHQITPDGDREQALIAVVYRPVVHVTRRIGNDGGIATVSFEGPYWSNTTPVVFDRETKDYVRAIENEVVLGDQQSITGTVSRLFDNDDVAQITIGRRREVRVLLRENDYDFVRYHAPRSATLTFVGRPIFRLGSETARFEEFQADFVHLGSPEQHALL